MTSHAPDATPELRVLAGEDSLEFRLLQLACEHNEPEPWLEGFLAPEKISPQDYVRDLRATSFSCPITVTDCGTEIFSTEIRVADVLIVEKLVVDEAVLAQAPRLKQVVVFNNSPRSVDLDACRRHNVVVTAVPRRTSASVADHTLMLLLALVRKLVPVAGLLPETAQGPDVESVTPSPLADSVERGGHSPTVFNWLNFHGIEPLAGKRFAVLGAGEIGGAVLRRAAGFDMQLGYVARHRNPTLETQLGATFIELADLATWADIVSLHIDYQPELHHVIDEKFLNLLGPRGMIINTSRGQLVDQVALAKALTNKTIAGAGLDVFAPEPLPDHDPVRRAPNVVLTPHVGAGSRHQLVLEAHDLISTLKGRSEK